MNSSAVIDKIGVVLICILFVFPSARGQFDNYKVEVGQTISIHSQMTGLPVVEPHLSTHPSNNDHLLIAGMIITDITNPYQSARLTSFVSIDGGKNWQETLHDYWGYDPWTAILPNGQTALSWLGTSGAFKHQFPIQFFRSADGGISWEDEIQTFASGHGHDGTKIVAYNNHFYFTTVRFQHDMSADVVLYHRENEGAFSEVARVQGHGVRLNFCEPAILSDGTVLVPSAHFLQKLWVQAYDPERQFLSKKYLVTNKPGGAKGYMRLVADTAPQSKFKDRAYVVRATGSRNKSGGVWLNYSADKGQSWSDDIRVDTFGNDLPSKAMVASIAVNTEGIIGISWVDCQNDPEQIKNDVYFTYSTDGGQSFHPPVRVTQKSTDPNTDGNDDVANKFPGGGHYLDLKVRTDNSFQLVWSDSRSGFFELQTCNLKLAKRD